MDKFEVDIEVLNKTREEYKGSVDKIRELKNTVVKTLEDLKGDGWNSKAGIAYFDNINEDWVKNVDLYLEVITILNEMLSIASREFERIVNEAKKLNL